MAKKNAINNKSDPLDATSITINGAYTLPDVDGTANQVIETDGGGNLSWTTPSGGASITWDTATNDTNAAVNYGYVVDSVSYVNITLPATCAVGDVVKIVGEGSGKWKVTPNTGDTIYYLDESVDDTSYFTATNYKGSCEAHCITANSEWEITEVEDTEFVKGNNIKINTGYYSSYYLNQYGALKAWGYNVNYALGDGTLTDYSSPIAVSRSYKYIDIAAGGFFNAGGTKRNGAVGLAENNHAVGIGYSAVMGIQSRLAVTSLAVKEPTGIDFDYEYIDVSTGGSHSLCLRDDYTAWAWGYNDFGELGTGNTTDYFYPVSVTGGHSFIQIDCCTNYTFSGTSAGLKSDGSIWMWGANTLGKLGTGNTTNYSSPVSVTGGHSFIQVACGGVFTIALKADGSVWGWGENTWGQLGDGTTVDKSSPVSAVGGHSFIDIAAGYRFTIALKADGTAYAWGLNNVSQLGTNNATHYSSPVSVVGGYSYIDIASGADHTLAVTHDNHIYAWGRNNYGQLGDNSTTNRSSPVSVIGL